MFGNPFCGRGTADDSAVASKYVYSEHVCVSGCEWYIRVLHTNHPMVLEHSYITNESEARVSVPGSQRNAFQAMVEQHPYTQTITNVERRAGVSISIFPGTMSTYKEYHAWEDIANSQARLVDSGGDLDQSATGEHSGEQLAASLINKYAGLTPMSTCIIEIPTLNVNQFMNFDMAYHFQDAIRARDPERLTAQFARPGRPMKLGRWNKFVTSTSPRTVY